MLLVLGVRYNSIPGIYVELQIFAVKSDCGNLDTGLDHFKVSDYTIKAVTKLYQDTTQTVSLSF